MKVDIDEESVPLLSSNNEKSPYQLVSTHDIREILSKESPKRELRNLVIWRICFVIVILSVLGLVATSTQMGIQFYVTSLKSTSTPPTEESSSIGGLISALKKHPPLGKMTSPRVQPVKSVTGIIEDMDNAEESTEETSPATEEKEEEQEEHLSTTTDTVLMPGSPTDPALEVQREKKISVRSSINTILPAANDQTTTTTINNKEDKSKVTKDTSKV